MTAVFLHWCLICVVPFEMPFAQSQIKLTADNDAVVSLQTFLPFLFLFHFIIITVSQILISLLMITFLHYLSGM